MLSSLRQAIGAAAVLFALLSSAPHVAQADDLCSIVPGTYGAAKAAYPSFAPALNELEKYSVATWYSDRVNDYASTMRTLVAKCPTSSRLSIVVYGLPNKDCEAGYSSSGSNKNAGDYAQFLNTLASIIGGRKVLYVLEPDAVGLLAKTGGCAERFGYRENLQTAIRILSANQNADIYLDVGYWTLQWPDSTNQVAGIVKTVISAGRVKGITLNTSNYRSSAEISSLCANFQRAMGSNAYRCVVDTSRNYVPPVSSEWCNVRSAGIGAPPTSSTGFSNLDYFMWIKVPGESDGTCTDGSHTPEAMVGPNAGAFFADHFKLLWDQGYFVKQLGFPKIGAPPGCAASGDACGNAAQGARCCAAAGDYCQPWNPDYYQCRTAPLLCGTQQVGVDFYGNDIATEFSLSPAACCAKCADTVGCRAYTFVNYNSDGRTACYLKSSTGTKRSVVGAVSAEVRTPKTACGTAVGGSCGTSQGTSCCPSGAYCQPWNSGYYQCLATPPTCAQQLTDVDLYGNDIATITGISPAECCARCSSTAGCKAYTFVNEGTPSCYLKSSTAGQRRSVGAVSGVLNY